MRRPRVYRSALGAKPLAYLGRMLGPLPLQGRFQALYIAGHFVSVGRRLVFATVVPGVVDALHLRQDRLGCLGGVLHNFPPPMRR